jgi:hypothetical protein
MLPLEVVRRSATATTGEQLAAALRQCGRPARRDSSIGPGLMTDLVPPSVGGDGLEVVRSRLRAGAELVGLIILVCVLLTTVLVVVVAPMLRSVGPHAH